MLMDGPVHRAQALYPLASVQRDIWFDQALYPDTPLYNVALYHRIRGQIDASILQQALTVLVQESDALRLVLTGQDGVALQSFPEMPHVELTVHDCSAEGDALQAALIRMRQSLRRPFRLFEEPLFRYTLYKLSQQDHIWSHTYHHLVIDGRAGALITQRVATLYSALLRGDPLPPRQGAAYREFVESDAAYLESAALEPERNYWRQIYATLPEPLLSPKPGYSNGDTVVPGAVHSFMLARERYAQLNALAQTHSVSVFHVFLGLLYSYFTRVQDQDECVIGLPVLNRNTPAFKQTIGLFVNTIPIRLSFGRELSFVALIQAIAANLRQSRPYQRVPLSAINHLAGLLQAGRKQLFDLSLSFVKQDHAVCFGASPPCETVKLDHGFEQTPLLVTVCEYSQAQDIQIDFSYNLAYFDAAETLRLQGRFMRLLEEVLRDPEQAINTLDILTKAERQQLLVEWNDRAMPPPQLCVHQQFEAQVANSPDATALIFDTGILTYAELNARANQLAHALIALGVGADEPVAIALERSPAMIVALLATLKAGAAFVPLDPDYPADRLAFMLKDCGARILITQETLRQQFAQAALHALCVDAQPSAISTQPVSNPQRTVAVEHLAYIIYTSGSTGQPKGVAVEHRSLANHAPLMQKCFELTAQDRVFQFASFSFDASVEQILPTICAGAAVVLPTPGLLTPETVAASLRRHAVTVLDITPAFFRAWSTSCDMRHTPGLRLIILAGEALLSEALAVRSRWPRPWPRLINVYGPTEATVTTTVYDIPELLCAAAVPIGRPLAGRRVYVLDRYHQLSPIGVAGELHIGGDGLARAYLNRPELSAEKFIPDLFSRVPGERLYKSGDLVRYLADGNLEFLGRIDHQVKIRGFRIELGEIEAALLAHPAIVQAVLVARTLDGGDQRLLAYVVAVAASAAAPPSAADLRAFLKITLPDYMLPATFVFLDALPLSPNGKVDRKALPQPPAAAVLQAVAARDALEEILLGSWATVLQHNSPGIEDNFFELGGHSLLAAQLASRLSDAVGMDIAVRWIFEFPTIAELAQRIRSFQQGDAATPAIPANLIVPGTTHISPDLLPLATLSQADIDRVVLTVDGGAANIQDIYPLAPLQEGILFHHLLRDSGDVYLGHALLTCDSWTRGQTFIAAMQAVIDRHDILRTAVVWRKLPEPLQVVWRHAALPVEVRCFTAEAGPISEQLLESVQPLQVRLDLTRAPLLRIVAARDGQRCLLLLLEHHLIMDHTTLEVVLEEAAALMQGQAQRLGPPVPFRNFVVQLRSGARQQAHEGFFRDMLGEIAAPTAPFGLLDVQGDGSATLEARHPLPAPLAKRLRQQARQFVATPAALCHLAWALVLSRCCQQADVVFGTVLFGRMQGGEGVERALGLFINTLPLRISCDARPVAQALRETQQRLLGLMRHEHASLSLAQRCSSLPAPTPLFSSLLNYRHSSQTHQTKHRLEGIEFLQTGERSNYPFVLSIDDLGEGFGLTVQVDAAVDPELLCTFMQSALEVLVTTLEQAPQTPLDELDFLPPNVSSSTRQSIVGTARRRHSGCL